jgi:hypothetical protein
LHSSSDVRSRVGNTNNFFYSPWHYAAGSQISNNKKLHEFKTKLEKILEYESGAQADVLDEKTRGKKSGTIVPLKAV